MVGRASALVATLALALAGCGSEAPIDPRSIPADALPGVPGSAVTLDAAAVAVDAKDRDGLAALLSEAGFIGADERSFAQVDGRRERALARVHVFASPDGAARYLDWLEGHVGQLIGKARALAPPRLGVPGFLAVHEPAPCCPKATPVYLAAWASGSTVVTLEVGGIGVEPEHVSELAALLHAAV